ncbi:hypothetical protein FF38_12608 [Lucilia cuprina]|uniref:Secreted protein n=1 Tax=Lucilia cuprina TaxID=7375 RepID=A0A0L0BMX7_LUCCU|nr:hypothetical protein FF38_12608 [Lucilia cuprina]
MCCFVAAAKVHLLSFLCCCDHNDHHYNQQQHSYSHQAEAAFKSIKSNECNTQILMLLQQQLQQQLLSTTTTTSRRSKQGLQSQGKEVRPIPVGCRDCKLVMNKCINNLSLECFHIVLNQRTRRTLSLPVSWNPMTGTVHREIHNTGSELSPMRTDNP